MNNNSIKHLIILMAASLCSTEALAQTALPACGGHVSSTAGGLSFTLGQTAVGYAEGRFTTMQWRGESFNEGVQQPYTVEELRGNGSGPLLSSVSIHPNPTTDGVTVVAGTGFDGGAFAFYSLTGRLLASGSLDASGTRIDMRGLPSGSYMLRLSDGRQEGKWKIIKK